MPKIAEIEYFRVPPRWLYVKVTDVEGNYGWGEASLEGHSEAVEGALDEFKDRFIGWEANNIENIWTSVWRLGFYRGGPVLQSALSGLDIALWDLKARRLNVPIYELLGGKVRNKIKVYAWIGGDRPDDVRSQAQGRLDQGFKAVKMNATADIGWLDTPSSLDSAADRLATVKSLGMDAGVDFHGRIHKPMAKQLAKLLEPHRPMFIEEPLLSENHEGVSEIAGQTSIPIALGERLYSRWDVKKFLNPVSIDILQPDIAHVGGITEIRKISAMCEAYDIAIAPHCPLGSIALAACFQIAACTQNHVIQEMSIGIHYNTEAGEQDIISYVHNPEFFDVKDGYVVVPEGPGLGIEVNEEAVRALSKNAKAWRSGGFVSADGSLSEW
ncbi:mandelate racemase/muconate lactonizing enzyme family protein [Myxozyma melibiosi]|uniref:Mandelate racemase/muconate lactonizing enzyme family protein n=1 Tax=Myxozyma melibiosi TaxID=54550 RepID=A0ABR1F403_9ASCO